ncbi:MAG: nucleotidyltransferase domain-containing protein, partial [Acetobacteraceae bacterium]|nr:nucleotidyltransferase domain-containing protein [Acetobacteraceae bacterium]
MRSAAALPDGPSAHRAPALAEVNLTVPDLIAELTGRAKGGAPLRREAALDLLRRHLGGYQESVQSAFEARELSGLAAARWLAALADGLMQAIHAYAEAMVPPGAPAGDDGAAEPPFALVATGGYGRGVLAPFSDIDLLFLTDATAGPRAQRLVEFVLYLLWDLGLKVGHATRSIGECMAEAGRDASVLTALVDARFLVGDRGVFDRFRGAFDKTRRERGFAPFLAAKRAERAARHARYGDSPYLVEPHIKEGRGGLRDLQTLYWLARYAFGTERMPELVGPDSPGGGLLTEQEAHAIRRAWNFLWTVRFHLHYVAGRAEERLTFDFQPVVGARMGYTPRGRQNGVERFMKHLFLTVRDVTRLTRILEPAIERAALGPPAVRRQGDARLAAMGLALADGKLVAAPPD